MSYSAADYLVALQQLLPPGAAFPRERGSNQTSVLAGMADTLARVDARADRLVTIEADPRQAIETLPEWEASLGLPDTCCGQPATIQGRQAAIYARLTEIGGHTAGDYGALAAKLGFAVQVVTFAPSAADLTSCEDALNDDDLAYVFQIVAVSQSSEAAAEEASAEDLLGSFGNASLECAINRVALAHLLPIFSYLGT